MKIAKDVIKALVKFDHEFPDRDDITEPTSLDIFPNPLEKATAKKNFIGSRVLFQQPDI